jgi:hypothetical protein
MRDDQAQRYARHIQLPDLGGLGQTAIMVSTAKLALREPDPRAELVAAEFLAAAGVGTLMLTGSTADQRRDVSAHAPDTRVIAESDGASSKEPMNSRAAEREVVLAPRPAWWPGGAGDDMALAYWRGGLAASRWLVEAAQR